MFLTMVQVSSTCPLPELLFRCTDTNSGFNNRLNFLAKTHPYEAPIPPT
jgi:hypothetical protein